VHDDETRPKPDSDVLLSGPRLDLRMHAHRDDRRQQRRRRQPRAARRLRPGDVARGLDRVRLVHLRAADDAGGTPSGPTYSCTPVPTSCHVFDCSSETCSQCIRDLCYYGASYGVYVTGRYLTCPGV